MQKNCLSFIVTILCGSLAGSSLQAQITGFNVGSSSATISFLDNNSFSGVNPGSTYTAPSGPWNGSTWALSQLDPTTLDFANGDVTATGAGNAYNVSLNNIVLTQAPLNTGYADLNFQFTVDYQLGGAGLPSLPTSYPNFLVSGTVQPTLSFAAIVGNIDYYGVDVNGVYGLVETVNYNWITTTPGPFANVLVSGVPVNNSTPILGPNTSFTLVGNITFTVDPASIIVETVPEPTAMAFAAFGAIGMLMARRRKV